MATSFYQGTSLSKLEAAVLARLERQGRSVVTLDELSEWHGRRRAYELVRSLTRKRVLERIGRGLYSVRPFRAHGRGWTISAPVAATHLLAAEPHYLGGRWAWWLHNLTRQIPASRIDAFVAKWRPVHQLANARICFHRVARAHLAIGVERTLIENTEVYVSDLERTMLDALDHPRLLGSLSEAVEQMSSVLTQANAKRIVSHATQVSRPSSCQRLAILLERAGVPPRTLAPLSARISETRSVLSLWPDRRREGPVHPRWRVVENDGAARS